jgi:hypothetical protein
MTFNPRDNIGFMNRCPELKVLKPRNLEIARAKCGTIENVEKYFDSLEEDFNKYGLQNKPHLIPSRSKSTGSSFLSGMKLRKWVDKYCLLFDQPVS